MGPVTAPAHLPVEQQGRDSSQRCCHLLSTVQFSTINFIHHHHEALQICTVGSASCKLLLQLSVRCSSKSSTHSSGFHIQLFTFHLCPSPLPCLPIGTCHGSSAGDFLCFPCWHFSACCLDLAALGLFESVLCTCILSPLPLPLQTFHPVQLLNSQELPHFSVISLFAVKHGSTRNFFPLKIFCSNAEPSLLNPNNFLTMARQGLAEPNEIHQDNIQGWSTLWVGQNLSSLRMEH